MEKKKKEKNQCVCPQSDRFVQKQQTNKKEQKKNKKRTKKEQTKNKKRTRTGATYNTPCPCFMIITI